MKHKTQCPHCNKSNVVKRGVFKSEVQGKRQRFYCKSCNKKFIQRDAFYRMRNNEKKITLSIDLFFKGLSLRKVQERLHAFHPHNASHVSVYNWIIKYCNMISKVTANVQIESGRELQSDEMEFYRLGEQNWFVDVICTKTRFMVASDYMRSRTIDNLTTVLKRGKFATGDQVKKVTTDGL